MAIVIPTHTHSVIDVDRPFVINPSTKEITAETEKLTLAQHSKDSERFTFTIPDTSIEGHDMSKCNSVKIHFENIGQEPGQISAGIYTVTDLAVADSRVTLSWLIDEDATRYTGGLIFSIHFGCLAADGSLVYNLPTLTYSKITVGATVWHSDTISREYPDIITEFEDRISSLENTAVRCTKQHFPEEKKAQARDNIGAADSAFVGDSAAALDAIIEMQEALLNASGIKPDDYGTPYAVEYIKQKLTEVAKAQARENIGAMATAGGTMTGAINMGGNRIWNIANPTQNGDAVNLAMLNSIGLPSRGVVTEATQNEATAQGIYIVDGWVDYCLMFVFVSAWGKVQVLLPYHMSYFAVRMYWGAGWQEWKIYHSSN